MTVRRPMQSPTSPRNKVTTPWPTSGDYSKALPHPPGHAHHEPSLDDLESGLVERYPSIERLESQEKRSSHPGGGHEPALRYETRKDDIATATPKSSSESQVDPRGVSALVPHTFEAPTAQNHPPDVSTNPFRRKSPNAAPDNQRSLGGAEESPSSISDRPRVLSALFDTSKDPVNDRPQPSSRLPVRAPQLDFAESHSPIDISGFSGDYFADLRQLQQDKINSVQPAPASSSHVVQSSAKASTTPVAGGRKTPDENVTSGQPEKPIDPGTYLDTSQAATSALSENGPPVGRERSPSLIPADLQHALPPSVQITRTPPRENESPSPPRPNSATQGAEPVTRQQQTQSPKPRKTGETYQIRLMNWHDSTSKNKLRQSPVMVQNANGPCPLLALVNALVLSTPSDLATALIETLRVREQVSLGLLLDAVIDELMSGRRIDTTQELPDVSDLYAFLLTLHTGMNVNPQFSAAEQPTTTSLLDMNIPAVDTRRQLGSFENTREMKLYSTFAVPLIHGWLLPRTHPACQALKRSANTYEDAQNLLFREEDLENKLQNQGLDSGEQLLLEDIASVKYFLSSTATQLTGYGLDSIVECLAPGAIVILFRNDHFSTLYKHPRSSQLLTLVTDMGYAGHDEVVWESLVDVSGEGSEFFSGDFRPVGNVVESTEHTGVDDDGWQTVTHRPRTAKQGNRLSSQEAPQGSSQQLHGDRTVSDPPLTPSKSTEQEDHDLALAMQLQEEEEERHRRDTAARRREDELSQRYLNNSDPATGRRTFPGFGRGARGGVAPRVPPRGGSNVQRSARQAPAVTRRQSSGEEAPPSYEVASKVEPYHPPPDHPSHPGSTPGQGGPPRLAGIRNRLSNSAYAEQASAGPSSPRGQGPIRPPASPSGQGPPLPRRPKGRSSWGANLENAPGVVRRTSPEDSTGFDDEPRKKEKECCVM